MSTTILYPLEGPTTEIAGVPRRFSLAALMVMVTAFAVLFSVLRSLHADPRVFTIVAVLFLGVTLGQMLLFGSRQPRGASALVGAVLFPVELVVLIAYEHPGRSLWKAVADSNPMCSMMAGAMLGYAAGTLMAGVFLLLKRLTGRSGEVPPEIELQQPTPADVDILLAWLRAPVLLAVWARRELSYPVTREQLQSRLSAAMGEDSARRSFKAVYPHTGRMVGYVELTGFDMEAGSATIELPIIDPAEPGRAELSMALLHAVQELAFEQLGLQSLDAYISDLNRGSLECHRAAGFITHIALPDAASPELGYESVWHLSVERDSESYRV